MEVAKNCMYIFLCKVRQPDSLQHDGMTNSEMEMCMWKVRKCVKRTWGCFS